MNKPIVHDVFFLSQKSVEATPADKQVIQDLLDTLKANQERCVDLAANMIGVRKTKRYQEIEVEHYDQRWKRRRQKYTGWIAQIIQHECDHLEGIINYKRRF